MRPISLHNQIKLFLGIRSLICIALFCIKNRQNSLIVNSLCHVNIAFKITHQDTMLPLWCVVLHYLKFVVWVNYRLPEFHQVGIVWLRSTLCILRILTLYRLFLNWIPKICCFIIHQYMPTMFFMNLVHLELIWMNRNIGMHFTKKIMNRCINEITDSTTNNIQRNFPFIQYFKQPSCIRPEHKIRLFQCFSCLLQRYSMRFEKFSLYIVKLID